MTPDPQTAADAAERVRPADEDYTARAIAMLREWFVIAEPSNDEDAIIDVPAVVIDAAVAALEQAADDRARLAAELEQVRGEREADDERTEYALGLLARLAAPGPCAVDGDGACRGHEGFTNGYLAPCPHAAARAFLAGAKAHRNAETTATRPADGLDGTGEGQRTRGTESGPQRPAQGDGAPTGRCICGCALRRRCTCDDSADHGPVGGDAEPTP